MTLPAVAAAAAQGITRRVRVPGVVWALPIYLFLLLFIVFPLYRLFLDAVTTEDGRLTISHLLDFAGDRFYRQALVNSLIISFGTVVGCMVIGFLAAFLLVRYDFPGRTTFGYLTLLPIIMPPLVGIMGLVFVLGRAGTVNVILMDYFGLQKPINFIYGWHGVLLAMTMHYFPLITLNLVDGLSKLDASHHDSATVYVTRDNHRENDFTPYVFVSNDWGKTFRSIASNLPTDRPGTAYVIREDPVNPNLLYVGTETGVYASLDKGQSWFSISNNLPVVPVYDLQVHPRDHELIAGTHGRAIWILDVGPLQQMTQAVLAKSAHLFTPTVSFVYGQTLPPSEPRSQRQWRSDGGPQGAEIAYRLTSPATGGVRVLVVDARGDTIARLSGDSTAGLHRASWNFQVTTPEQQALIAAAGRGGAAGGPGGFGAAGLGAAGGGRGGRGGVFSDTAQVPGFPRGFNPRPAESLGPADTSGSPTAVQRALAEAAGRGGAGGRGGRGGGGGRGGPAPPLAETGDYRVVLDVGGQKLTAALRVVRLVGGEVSVMVPGRPR